MSFQKLDKLDFYSLILILLISLTTISYQLNLLQLDIFNTPLGYQGDGLLVLGNAKLIINSFPNIASEKLNYPYGMDLESGYLHSDKLYQILVYIVGKVCGPNCSITTFYILNHITAGIAFYIACRLCGIKRSYSIVFALVFAFTPFIFKRGIAHITTGFIFIVPLLIIMIWNLSTNINLSLRERKIHFIILFLSTITNIYYLYITLIIIFGLLIFFIFKKEKKHKNHILKLIIFSLLIFIIFNYKFIFYSIIHDGSVNRGILGNDFYGLRLPELFFPTGWHKISILPKIGSYLFYGKTELRGEFWSPYIGLSGILATFMFLIISLKKFAEANKFYLGNLILQINFVTLFSLIGGIGLMIAIFGPNPARAANRYSIWLLATLLIFIAKFLTDHDKFIKEYQKKIIIFLFLILSFLDLPKPLKKSYFESMNNEIQNKKQLVSKLITKSKKNIINLAFLPHMNYPENGPAEKIIDYEYFKFFLASDQINLSYGGNKYNKTTPKISIDNKTSIFDSIKLFKILGYDYVLINKDGYSEYDLKKNVNALNKLVKSINVNNSNYLAYDLKSLKDNSLESKNSFFFTNGWSVPEQNWRWSESNISEILVHQAKKISYIELTLHSFRELRNIDIFLDKELIKSDKIDFNKKKVLVPINTNKKYFNIIIKSSGKPRRAGANDGRKLSFALFDLTIK
jgi:hypothetical protein